MEAVAASLDARPKAARVAPWPDARPWLGSPARLRARAREDGFLYFRRLIEADALERLRADAIDVCRTHGLAGPDDPVRAVRGAPLIERSRAWWAFHADMLRVRSLYALAWSTALRRVITALVAEDAFPHPCSIFRVVTPGEDCQPKPAHQDLRYVGGGDTIWTAWIAIDDCPRTVGGIEVLAGSHRGGVLPVRPAGSGHEAVFPTHLPWVGGDLLAGDAIVFSAQTVHRGLPNTTAHRLRLSADYRFQSRRAPVRLDALLPHLRFLTWADVYRRWPEDDPLRYYWRAMDLTYATA